MITTILSQSRLSLPLSVQVKIHSEHISIKLANAIQMSPELCLPESRHGYLLSSGLGLHFKSLLSPRNSTRSQQTDCARLFQALMLLRVLLSSPQTLFPHPPTPSSCSSSGMGRAQVSPSPGGPSGLPSPRQGPRSCPRPGHSTNHSSSFMALWFLAYWLVFPP